MMRIRWGGDGHNVALDIRCRKRPRIVLLECRKMRHGHCVGNNA